jgi:hypothetical protein
MDHDHRAIAVETFNETWTLLDRPDRTSSDDLDMVALTLTSRYHWRRAGDARNHAMSDWQASRVFASIGEAELARAFADAAIELCVEHELDAFMTGFAEEALARALIVGGDQRGARQVIERARHLEAAIPDPEDRTALATDLDDLERRLG